MRVIKPRKFALLAAAIVVASYVVWCVWPHFGELEITNDAGLNGADLEQVLDYLEKEEAFYGKGMVSTMITTVFAPRSRPHYFAEISGDTSEIDIMAGYFRGPLWGGGPIIRAKKVNGRWIFERSSLLWRS